MQAKDVMTRQVVTVAPEASVAEVAEILSAGGISAAPVVDPSGAILGIVSEGDLVHRLANQSPGARSWWLDLFRDTESRAQDFVKVHGASASQVMTREVVTVGPQTPVSDVAALLEQRRIKRVPVVADGKIVGIVSRANLLHALAAEPRQPAKTDSEVRNRILDLIDQSGVSGHRVNVIVSDDRIQVWGAVSSDAQRNAVRLAVESEASGRRIENHLGVLPIELEGRGWA